MSVNLALEKPLTSSGALASYDGAWTMATASHLMRRATYGPRYDEIKKIYDLGLDDGLDYILRDVSLPPPPQKFTSRDGNEPKLKVGESWINTAYNGSTRYRSVSLRGWYYNVMMSSETSIQQRMSFFWLNYFAMANVMDHRCMYSYLKLYMEQATGGNLREMLRKITVHPAMLQFLDGAVNSRRNPNENYARELMELFTVGKGELAGEGDYTTFTEQDVAALARALTGWKNHDFAYSKGNEPVASYFDASDHDTGNKKLSHRFGGQVIKNHGKDEYKVVIDILLEGQNAARHFCRELYRFFVFHDISDYVEREVIRPLARTLTDNDFDIRPVIKRLLGSKHFFYIKRRGAILKNPHDFLTSILRPFREYEHEDLDLYLRYRLGDDYYTYAENLDLLFLEPPTVSGWKAYYDAPQYYRHWISPALLQYRFELSSEFTKHTHHVGGHRIDLDYYGFVDSLPSKMNIDDMVNDIMMMFLPRDLQDEQIDILKEHLTGGMDDHDWPMEMRGYLNNPGVREYREPMENRLRSFFTALFGMAEFQLQ